LQERAPNLVTLVHETFGAGKKFGAQLSLIPNSSQATMASLTCKGAPSFATRSSNTRLFTQGLPGPVALDMNNRITTQPTAEAGWTFTEVHLFPCLTCCPENTPSSSVRHPKMAALIFFAGILRKRCSETVTVI
jgi:hypothetical protein